MSGFGRESRLLTGSQFRDVFQYRKPVHGRYFSIHSVPNHLGYSRIGLAVSKKVSRRAVQRNRIKRQAREVFRHNQIELQNRDFVVVAKVGCAAQETSVLRRELVKLWGRFALSERLLWSS